VVRNRTIIDFRVLVLVKVGRISGPQLNMYLRPDLPLLGFHLLMVLTLTSVRGSRSTTVTLQLLLVCCQTESSLRSTA
jgi:hypothetical protein